jgi:hypothetical protein
VRGRSSGRTDPGCIIRSNVAFPARGRTPPGRGDAPFFRTSLIGFSQDRETRQRTSERNGMSETKTATMAPKICPACGHPKKATIDRALSRGQCPRNLARKALRRHRDGGLVGTGGGG